MAPTAPSIRAGRRKDPKCAKATAPLAQFRAPRISLGAPVPAALTSRSPFHIARAFSQATGLPPHAYLESVRMRRARELLRSGISVVETALAVGYPDQSHFTHRFRRHTGFTPGQYRTVVI